MLHCALFSATSGLNALPSISRDSPLPVNLPPVSPKVWGNFADSIMHYVKRYCLERNTVRARHKVRDFSLFLVLCSSVHSDLSALGSLEHHLIGRYVIFF